MAPEPAAGPAAVERVVSQRGGIQVGSQRLQVGLRHARKRVMVLVHEDRFEVLDQGELLIRHGRASQGVSGITRSPRVQHHLSLHKPDRPATTERDTGMLAVPQRHPRASSSTAIDAGSLSLALCTQPLGDRVQARPCSTRVR
jgi:hypothetical protein